MAAEAAMRFLEEVVDVPVARLHELPMVIDALLGVGHLDLANRELEAALQLRAQMTTVPLLDTNLALAAQIGQANGDSPLVAAKARHAIELAGEHGFVFQLRTARDLATWASKGEHS
jgi:hypothetical protein